MHRLLLEDLQLKWSSFLIRLIRNQTESHLSPLAASAAPFPACLHALLCCTLFIFFLLFLSPRCSPAFLWVTFSPHFSPHGGGRKRENELLLENMSVHLGGEFRRTPLLSLCSSFEEWVIRKTFPHIPEEGCACVHMCMCVFAGWTQALGIRNRWRTWFSQILRRTPLSHPSFLKL